MHTQTAATGETKTRSKREVSIIIFGRDSKRKGHAAAFSAEDAGLALKAARLMKLNAWQVPPAAKALALRVPKGKLFGSGRALAPLVNAKLMAELEREAGKSSPSEVGAAGDGPAEAPSEPAGAISGAGSTTPSGKGAPPASASPKRPAEWGQIGIGSEVLADSKQDTWGWYEAIVVRQISADQFELQWINYPDEPHVIRRRDDLGLLSPKHAIAKP